ANSLEMLVRLAINGAGIAMCELRSVEPHVRLGQLVRVLPEWQLPPAPLYAVFPQRKLLPARTRVFIDALADRFHANPRTSSATKRRSIPRRGPA
ncbi:MAG TPA: LysR substrate-binding domain-containing protein, partial [Usitatibacter sp.]|nr:LysR substrate-binding domain-containing protein [Usitatibacter sp.]